MAETFLLVLMFMLGFFAVIMIWTFYCNNLTCKQKLRLIDATFVKSNIDWKKDAELIDSVSYNRHLLALVFFQNWRKLYPEELRNKFPEAFK